MGDDLRETVREILRKQANEQEEVGIGAIPRFHVTLLGEVCDGRCLFFDNQSHVFLLDAHPADLDEVRKLDYQGGIHWRYLEQRDWMHRLDAQAYAKVFQEEQMRLGNLGGSSGLNEQLRQHARKDDSYLHGQIVDTNQEEAAVKAVLQALVSEQNQ